MTRRFTTLLHPLLPAIACLSLAGCPSHAQPQPEPPSTRVPAPRHEAVDDAPSGTRTAVFAGGCFWGMQWLFEHVRGVRQVTAGYAGGSRATASYAQVSSGGTGHAEAVRIRYDPEKISYGQLLRVYFAVAADPTQRNRQGPDVGTQYRGVIFYTSQAQQRTAGDYIRQLDNTGLFNAPIVTEVAPLAAFYRAEEYHQDYARKHPHDLYIVINDAPKVEALRQHLPALYRAASAPVSP